MVSGLYFNNIVTKSLQPINSEDRFFEGYLTVQMKDKQGEITIVDELYKVLPVWMDRGAPISDTHSNRIIGKGINYAKTIYKDGDGVEYPAIKITGKIHKNYELDNDIWDKIKSGEYKGLSFGGATRSDRTPIVMKDGSIAYALKDLEHYEVAVCKDPAVPLALITDYNRVAKAMAGYTEDRGDKMLIKCSKFGCYVEKEHKQNFDAKTGKLNLKNPTEGDGTQAMVTSPETGNKVVATGGNKQLKEIKRLQSGVKKDSLVKIEDEEDENTKATVLDEWENETNPKDDNLKKGKFKKFLSRTSRPDDKYTKHDVQGKRQKIDELVSEISDDPQKRVRTSPLLEDQTDRIENGYEKLGRGLITEDEAIRGKSYVTKPISDGHGGSGDFKHCEDKNRDKNDPSAFCGAIQRDTEGKKKAKSVSNITIMKAPKKEGIGNITNMKPPKVDKKLQEDILDHITQSYLQTKANKIMANMTILQLGTSLLKKTL